MNKKAIRKADKYTVYSTGSGVWTPQVRDAQGCVVAVFPTMGGQYATNQSVAEAHLLAMRYARFLNEK